MAKISIDLGSGSIKKEEIIVGIDLGTTNSLVAFINKDTKLPVSIAGTNKEVIVPSIIHFEEEDRILVGNNAKDKLITHPERTIYSVKRLLGKSYSDLEKHRDYFSYQVLDEDAEELVKVRIGSKFYSPVELSAMILKELKFRASKALGMDVTRAVITVPAYFNDSQRQATRDAGKLAGLDVLRIVNEPTAASLAYGIGLGAEEEKTIAVYDLGGGTFDISILKIHNGIFEVLATNGDTFLGGDDFDRLIMDHWISLSGQDKTELLKDRGLIQDLRLKAEEIKKELSSGKTEVASGEIRIPQTGDILNLSLSRTDFDSLIRPVVEKTIECCENALHDAGLKVSDMHEVVMVGGSTRTPLVKKMVSEFFGNMELHDKLNPDEVVALGAAVEADILAGNRRDILLLDVTPLSLGIETLGGLMDVIIPRNSRIPTKAGRQYTTSIDGQVNLKISVFQGERDLVSENRKLAEFILKGIPAMPAGFPKVHINFLLNADGILRVDAMEERSGVKQEIEIIPQYGLSDDQVEKMLMDSLKNAEKDMQQRMLIEARTEAEQLIYLTERFMGKNSDILSEEEASETRRLIVKLKALVQTGNKDEILSGVEELNDYTRPFAEKLMDVSISKALKGKSI